MMEQEWLAERFEEHRSRLRAVAYRMLGSLSEADDAVQEAWIRLSRSDASEIDSLGAWLTTVVGRVSLTMLRTRRTRREDSLELSMPDPIVDRPGTPDPEHEAILADSVGLALLVVLDRLSPAERLAFVLHDMFAMPFDEVAAIIDRSPEAARQLASRGRRRVRGADLTTAGDPAAHWSLVEAFLAAARNGDFEALVAVLDPEVTFRVDTGPMAGGVRQVQGAESVARMALGYARLGLEIRPALVNGVAGAVSWLDGEPYSIGAFTIRDQRITGIDMLADPGRLRRLDLSALEG